MRQRRATKLPLATLIGNAKQEGITAKGSYTWGNSVALRFRPRLVNTVHLIGLSCTISTASGSCSAKVG